jgi:hypothetical protein
MSESRAQPKPREPTHTQHNTKPPLFLICTLPKSPFHCLPPSLSLLSPRPPSMRIRRRPPGQPLGLGYLVPSDLPPAPRLSPAASADHQDRPAAPGKREGEEEVVAGLGLHLHPNAAAADLVDRRSSPARCPALLPLLPKVRMLVGVASCSLDSSIIGALTPPGRRRGEFVRRTRLCCAGGRSRRVLLLLLLLLLHPL